jgi:hypothetical protein
MTCTNNKKHGSRTYNNNIADIFVYFWIFFQSTIDKRYEKYPITILNNYI